MYLGHLILKVEFKKVKGLHHFLKGVVRLKKSQCGVTKMNGVMPKRPLSCLRNDGSNLTKAHDCVVENMASSLNTMHSCK